MRYPLTEEQLLIQQNAREFAGRYVEPVATAIDRQGSHPEEMVRKMAEHDFFGLPFPQEYGGVEAGFLSYVLAVEEISRACASLGSILINHCSLAAYAIYRWGTAAQKERFLSPMCGGEKLGAFALYEPGASVGCGEHRVVAVRKGDGYVLNGRKYFVANGGAADVYIVFALTEPEKGLEGLSAFIVEKDVPGFNVLRQVEKMGLNGLQAAELALEGVEVSGDSLLGPENGAAAMLHEALALGKISAAAQITGIMQAALAESVKYAGERVQFDQPIARFPAIRQMIATMSANLHLARLAVYSTADLVDKGEPFIAEAAMVHMFAARAGQGACIDAIQVHGGYGYSQELIVERLFRDVKGALITDSLFEYPDYLVAENALA
ncbi:acyl-CoA dehydrogenase family protein [Moorella sulfitireducens]|uniref:acyl-CoA dehydrogenase family protein n=1 Tax=Neomoorella sulfitireducens TaxID=2972948 RepID=UPI0021AC2AF6|nr:acyl-CoA dehydrogenase family protein [Moorella sulfitireducens]